MEAHITPRNTRLPQGTVIIPLVKVSLGYVIRKVAK
jgi:hypothetical protein